ncbi:hypothetical protein JD844_005179 [Phrynosoma platyrhinos]|uniref:Antizyme inhibitor 2 n=1 Tax=Phrynosoma platyrhinos TaxID=52577 RepID=A0ABQ7TPK8_PHRPL|nr:hypothetical protein JD844_005179 [Phrynosoma platyrhinos]
MKQDPPSAVTMTRCLDESDVVMVEEGFTTRDVLENLLLEVAETGSREAFFVADLEDVVKKHLRLLKALPRIKPFYSLKCNRSKGVVQMLAGLGAGFGCASKTEMALVKSIGVPPDRIICTSPCKQLSLIRYAVSQGVQLMTFDNEVELGKVARTHPSARRLLKKTAVVNSALDLYFPEGCGVEIIAELGRYYVDSAFTLAVSIVAKKEVPLDQPGSEDEDPGGKKSFVYHLNDGIYDSFGSVIFNNACPVPLLHKVRNVFAPRTDQDLHSSSFWGPTGDSLDRIADGVDLPELHVGDWLIFENMGAYTVPPSASLSGAQQAPIHYAISRMAWEAVQLLWGKLLHPEEEDRESACTPLSCGWEITDTLCVAPVFTPASIM